jgi:hypothetical protein
MKAPFLQRGKNLRRDPASDEDTGGRHAAQREIAGFGAVGLDEHAERLDAELTATGKGALRDAGGCIVGGEVVDDRAAGAAVGEAMKVDQPGPAQHVLHFDATEFVAQRAYQIQLAIGARGEVGVAAFRGHRTQAPSTRWR